MNNWLKEALEKYVSFKDDEWEFFMYCSKNVKLKPKDIFLRSGEIANKVGFLRKGILRACQENKKGELITCYFYYLPHNNIVTLQTSFALEIPSEHSVEAITDCEILCFEKDHINNCLSKYPVFEKLARKIAEKQYLDSSKRINDFQTKDAKEIYNHFINEYGDIALKTPQYMIASYLGMSQYTLSKIKK
jgi:CRP-like cAMP-binding protein